MFDVKPKDKDDYYQFFGWLVSKKLAYVTIILVGVISAYFLYGNRANIWGGGSADGVKTFKYNSLMLRFTTGDVRIKAKSGYTAYEGAVQKGKVTGAGKLYDKNGTLVYEGNFEDNEYSGQGIRYYENGNLWYNGSFLENLFSGQGIEYRRNGSRLYEGDYVSGMKQGNGTLYDNGNNPIYTGEFSADHILYSALLGKTAAEVSEAYTGERVLYEGSDVFDVYLPDIEALYQSSEKDNSLDDSMKVDRVYVLKHQFDTNAGSLKTMDEIEDYFGDPVYEGYSDAEQSELLSIHFVRDLTGDVFYDDAGLVTTSTYDDYLHIEDYNDMVLYLYSFEQGGIRYTFIARDINQPFGFYIIEEVGQGMDDNNDNEDTSK